ncbi:uncharacterized protein LOC141638323 [Silene latifolia]|uniref:uncharacterized protein LOC141638323 n=1 Tax=Silene latifolia TaxID=37657 RepID=UPI003D76EAE6
MRGDNAERRLFTPGGLSFMESLTLSLQKSKAGLMERYCLKKVNLVIIILIMGSLGFWNVRGMNKTSKQNEIKCCHKGGRIWLIWDPGMFMVSIQKGCGSFYTWTNKHEVGDKVYSRIDRVFTNEECLNVFPGSYANFLPEGLFDHCPCLINLEETIHNRKMPFKYFNMWASAPDFLETVQNSWGPEVRGNAMFTVVTKLKRLKKDLKALNKEQFSDIENLTRVAELSLEHYQTLLREDPLNERICQAESECAKEVRLLQQARTDYLQQKAKISWALDGDENSAVFHASIRKRRRKNKLFQVKDMWGKLRSKNEEIKQAFEEYYISLLGTSMPVSHVNKKIVSQGHALQCITVRF